MPKGGKRPGAGRPKGSLDTRTIEKKAAEKLFTDRVIKHVDQLFNSQLFLAEGQNFVYRIDYYKDEDGKKRKKFVLVSDPEEITSVLDETEGLGGMVDEKYYVVTSKSPDNKAIDSLMDRAFGKAISKTELSGKDGDAIQVKVISYGDNPSPPVPAPVVSDTPTPSD